MKSLSLSKLLFYLDLSFQRIVQLDEGGDKQQAQQRLRIMESILTRALISVQRMLATIDAEQDQLDIEAFKQQLAELPETRERS